MTPAAGADCFGIHVFGSGRVFVSAGNSGEIRLSAPFADLALLRRSNPDAGISERTVSTEASLVRYYPNIFSADKSKADHIEFNANPVTGVLAVTSESLRGIALEILPLDGVVMNHYGKTEGRDVLRFICGDRSLYAVTDGNTEFSSDGMTILFGEGSARLLFIQPGATGGMSRVRQIADAFSGMASADGNGCKTAVYAYKDRARVYFRRAAFGSGTLSDFALSCFRTARNLRSRTGGIRCSLSSWQCDAGEMSDYLLFACVFEIRPIADGVAETFYRIFRECGHFPQIFSADGSKKFCSQGAASSSGLMAILALFRYEEHFCLRHSRLRRLAEGVLSEQLSLLKNGMLPFAGTEKDFACGNLPGDMRFHGSALNTMLFIRASEIFLSLPGSENSSLAPHLRSAVTYAKNSFSDNFVIGSIMYVNSPKRYMNIRLPHTATGICRVCREPTVLTRSGCRYLCRNCGSDNGGAEYCGERIPLPSAPFFVGKFIPGIVSCRLPERDELDGLSLRELEAGIAFYRCDLERQTDIIMAVAKKYITEPHSFSPGTMCRLAADIRLYRPPAEYPSRDTNQ